ncbi:hypothetical protein DFS34DRAFT_690003 [Phlyctochytrium arcticum]|nr:hypothetical protein DFS34DRAFT_690003 [Phlyctochytrium arcticum]
MSSATDNLLGGASDKASRTVARYRRQILAIAIILITCSLFYLAIPFAMDRMESKSRQVPAGEPATGGKGIVVVGNETSDAIADGKNATTLTPKPPPAPAGFSNEKIAVLLELRRLPVMVPMLLHYMAAISDDWPFRVFHSKENSDLLTKNLALQRYIKSGKLTFQEVPEGTVIRNGPDVSHFLTRRWIWEQFQAESIFFFQLDAMICSNSDMAVDDFLQFDWIGAPWPHIPHLKGGNGGFSIRKRSRLLRCLDKQTWEYGHDPEDVWYSKCLASFEDAVMPTFEDSKRFSLEGAQSDHFLGIHKPYNGIRVKDQYEFCPEARLLFNDG